MTATARGLRAVALAAGAALAATAAPRASFAQRAASAPAAGAPAATSAGAERRNELERALRRFFAKEPLDRALLRDVVSLATGHEDLLSTILEEKSFVEPCSSLAEHGVIDAAHRFRAVLGDAGGSRDDPRGSDENAALFYGPRSPAALAPLVVYVPDHTSTAEFVSELASEARRGRFVFLVPDEKRDNRWNPTPDEHRRHVGPLRDLLLGFPIDPNRVFLVGTGRGGHATWAVGLLYADRFAGLAPCNGGLIHEGGYKAAGGVFLENAKSLSIHLVFNNTFDHGIEGCRYAVKKFAEWGFRCRSFEEPKFREMRISEAMEGLAGAVRDPHPREIQKRFNHLDAGEHFWLRALDRVPKEWDPAQTIHLKGTWPSDVEKQREMIWDQVKKQCGFVKGSIAGNRITIAAQGVGRLRVFFDPVLVDLGRPIQVTINGRQEPPVRAERSLETMLEHVHETGDTSRLYEGARDFAVP